MDETWPPSGMEPGKYQLFELAGFTASSRLWRYMSFEKFCYLIESSKLYHTRLDQFQDPFEGSVTHAYANMRDSGGVNPYFSTAANEPWIFKQLRLLSYATCWYAGEEESDAQWRLYGPGAGGIAIVSTLEGLYRSVSFGPHHGMLSDVQYVDFENHPMRHITGGLTVMRPGFLKRKSFEHEKEVRGIIQVELDPSICSMDDAALERLKAGPTGVEADVVLDGLLEEIVLSPLAPPYLEFIVRRLTARHALDHLVRKSRLCGVPSY